MQPLLQLTLKAHRFWEECVAVTRVEQMDQAWLQECLQIHAQLIHHIEVQNTLLEADK
jgi:hypothetical protein